MIPQRIDPRGDPCTDYARWLVSPVLMEKLQRAAGTLPFDVFIISGYRSCEEQQALAAAGRPAADCHLSTHVATCPATGADVKLSVPALPMIQAQFGQAVVFAGLRWGGGSPVDPETGIPSDWNHVDLGPVSSHVHPM